MVASSWTRLLLLCLAGVLAVFVAPASAELLEDPLIDTMDPDGDGFVSRA